MSVSRECSVRRGKKSKVDLLWTRNVVGDDDAKAAQEYRHERHERQQEHDGPI